jgi:hypothetical protein
MNSPKSPRNPASANAIHRRTSALFCSMGSSYAADRARAHKRQRLALSSTVVAHGGGARRDRARGKLRVAPKNRPKRRTHPNAARTRTPQPNAAPRQRRLDRSEISRVGFRGDSETGSQYRDSSAHKKARPVFQHRGGRERRAESRLARARARRSIGSVAHRCDCRKTHSFRAPSAEPCAR